MIDRKSDYVACPAQVGLVAAGAGTAVEAMSILPTHATTAPAAAAAKPSKKQLDSWNPLHTIRGGVKARESWQRTLHSCLRDKRQEEEMCIWLECP